MSACPPVYCALTTTRTPQAVDFKQTSKKYSRNDYSADVSPAVRVRDCSGV